MAKFILGNKFRDQLEGWPLVQHAIWLLETLVIGVLLILFWLIPVRLASNLCSKLLIRIGPKLKKNKAFKLNFKTAFPQKSAEEIQQLVQGAWANAGRVLAEYLHLTNICNNRLEVEILGDSEVFRNPATPAVFVTAHYANWELAAGAVAQQGIDIAVVYSPLANPWLDRLMSKFRTNLNCGLLARDESMRGMLRQLKKGSIGLVIDQRVDSGVPLPFFGMDKNTTLVPARLALSKHCELIPIQIERKAAASYRVTFHPSIRPTDPDASAQDQAIQMTTRINEYFEEWIRANPGDWFCSKRRWQKVRKPARS